MRIVLHDGSGHAFTVQLARELAHRGHAVLYVHFAGFQGPKGPLRRREGDSPGLEIAGLDLDAPYAKYSLLKRRQQEIAYGKMAAARTLQFEPDVVIAANLSLEQLRVFQARCLAEGVRFITWVQDIYSAAIRRLLSRRMPGLGEAVGSYYQRMERISLLGATGSFSSPMISGMCSRPGEFRMPKARPSRTGPR